MIVLKRFLLVILIIIVSISLSYAQEGAVIPEQVKSILKGGLESLETRIEIPFVIVKHLYLPAKQNVHSIVIFKFKEKESPSFTELINQGYANLNVFMQFYQLSGGPPSLYKDVYTPMQFQAIEDEEANFYTIGYPLPSGDYILAMAITSKDLGIIGTQYFEFSLPSMTSSTLNTTPIFFVKKLEKMASAERQVNVHRGYFTYSVLRIEPNLGNLFSPVDNMDVFYFIYGSNPTTFNVDYYVYKDKVAVVDYQSITYDTPIVSQPLPLQEKHNLTPGIYTFSMDITDQSTGKKISKKTNVEIR